MLVGIKISPLTDLYSYNVAVKFYEFSSQLNNSRAHFRLGVLYSLGDFLGFETNIDKSINYYLKNISVKRGYIKSCDINDNTSSFIRNNYRYISYNDLGLIYLTVLNNCEDGIKKVKKSAYNEYSFGQNNLGLINQFYSNDINNARYMYKHSSEHDAGLKKCYFALAEYNLGYLEEEEGKLEEAIKYYIRASKHEDEPLIFREITHFDVQLEISKTFIICFTNLKLTEYYFSKEKYNESRNYFIKSFDKLKQTNNHDPYPFKFESKNCSRVQNLKNLFSYLKSYIFNFPDFNLINQPNINLEQIFHIFTTNTINFEQNKNQEDENKIFSPKIEKMQNTIGDINNGIEELYKLEEISENKSVNMKEEIFEDIILEDPNDLFEFVIKNQKNKKIFMKEIKSIFLIMKKILYTKPYSILFGRINLSKPKPKENQEVRKIHQNITKDFYNGFGFPI